MREIKFRAWDKFTKEWRTYTLQDLVINGNYAYWRDLENWRQFTGLKDRNRTEIYEGDIVKLPYYIMGKEPAYFEIREVVFHKGMFGVFDKNKYDFTELSGTEKAVKDSGHYIPNFGEVYEKYEPQAEVIGNIYENPELLEPQE